MSGRVVSVVVVSGCAIGASTEAAPVSCRRREWKCMCDRRVAVSGRASACGRSQVRARGVASTCDARRPSVPCPAPIVVDPPPPVASPQASRMACCVAESAGASRLMVALCCY